MLLLNTFFGLDQELASEASAQSETANSGTAPPADNASANQAPGNQTDLVETIISSNLPAIFIIVVFLMIIIPLVLDIILAYTHKPTEGSTDKDNDRDQVRGLPGLYRSLMTFGIIMLLGTVIFYLLALIGENMENPDSPAFVSLVDLLRNLGIILGTALATIIAFYFGIRGSESSVEKASNAIISGLKFAEAADVEGPPKVLSTKPSDGAENVPTDTLISATFNEPMSSGTINSTTFSVRKDGGSLINGKISLSPDPKTAEFNPDQDLEQGTRYIAEISEIVKDLAGNAVGSITRWSFTTAEGTEGARTEGTEGARTEGTEGARTEGTEGARLIRASLPEDRRIQPAAHSRVYDGKPRQGKPSPDLNTDIDQFSDLDVSNIKRTIPCGDIEQLKNAIENAQAGDLIFLADGEYILDKNMIGESLKLEGKKKGTDEAPIIEPIIVRAQHVGGVSLKGSAAFNFSECTYFTWYGFNHAHEATTKDDNIVFEGGNNNRFARCDVKLDDIIKIGGNNIKPKVPEKKLSEEEKYSADKMCGKTNDDDKCPNARHWLNISNCTTMKVDHCYFHEKLTPGNFCVVGFKSNNIDGQGPLFEYNHFEHHDLNLLVKKDDMGDAGGEAVRIGLSTMDRTYIKAIFRYNYLEECNGDGEIVTNKSSGNIYFNNSFVNNNGSLTLRHGDTTAVLGNYFKASGLRVYGADNLIANNHFTLNSNSEQNRWPLVIMKGKVERPTQKGGNEERVVNNDIILNTFANGAGTAKKIVRWGGGDEDDEDLLEPTENRFMGNIITGKNGELLAFEKGTTARGDKDRPNVIKDNIGWATDNASLGGLTKEMATINKPPLLTENPDDGIYQLSDSSLARGMIEDTPFSLSTDIDIYGVTRGPDTDAGCHQFSTLPRKKRVITNHEEDVGPKATLDLGDYRPAWPRKKPETES